jgi:hypothetical protein
VKITKDMLDLARHIVDQKSGHFAPGKFEDHYEAAVSELLVKKQKGPPLTAAKKPAPDNVVNLMDALRRKYRTESQTGPLFRQAGETSREESGKIEEIRLRKLPGPAASSRIEPEVWALREGLHPHAVKGSGEPLRGPLTAYPAHCRRASRGACLASLGSGSQHGNERLVHDDSNQYRPPR